MIRDDSVVAEVDDEAFRRRDEPVSHCDGCDSNQSGVLPFRIHVVAPRIDGNGYPNQCVGWQRVYYCPDCAAEATAGEIAEIVDVVPLTEAEVTS